MTKIYYLHFNSELSKCVIIKLFLYNFLKDVLKEYNFIILFYNYVAV